MASFDNINYSLRPNKHIERALAFEGVRMLQGAVDLRDLVYVGFGSIWFSDFHLAHKILGIKDMRSMEGNPIGYARANFNRPYKTVEVSDQWSSAALPLMYADPKINVRPWLVWLDYDTRLEPSIVDDIRSVIENCPPNSIFLVTFSATIKPYGRAIQRPQYLRETLGAIVPDDLEAAACGDTTMAETLAGLTLDFMTSTAASMARPGGFKPAFRLIYTDSATMVTVGGVLPGMATAPAVNGVLRSSAWPAMVDGRITAPHLTIKEVAMLQAQLPGLKRLNRAKIRKLGFDLEEEQITSFERYYRYYPSFAQISV